MPGITTFTHPVSDSGATDVAQATPLERLPRELDSLSTVAEVANRTHDLRLIMQAALEQIAAILGISRGLAYRLANRAEAPDEQCLSLVAWLGFSETFLRQFSMMPLHGSLTAQAALAGQPLVWRVTDYPNARLRQEYAAEGIHLGVTVPLLVQGQIVGAFGLGLEETRTFSPAELQFLHVVAQQTSTAVEMSRLREAADQSMIAGEASHLARALHDSVTQHLYDLTLYAETITRLLDTHETAQAADYVQSMHAAALEALHEMRLLASELHPPELTKVGLAAALQARLIALTGWGGVTGDFVVNEGELAALLPLVVQQELYQIAQEALYNALKHAHARRIELSLSFGHGRVALAVRDDGVGFDAGSFNHAEGLGLRTMRERARRIGGTLRIDSTPGEGTQVHVSA